MLDLHRIRSAGTAQSVLRWWLRRMRVRALAPLDIKSAGAGTRAILELASSSAASGAKDGNTAGDTSGITAGSTAGASMPVMIRDLPEVIQVVTGWGKHSTVFGYSPVKGRAVHAEAMKLMLRAPETTRLKL